LISNLYSLPEHHGLHFSAFVHFLVFAAVYCLSKRQFAGVYPTYAAKVEVLLRSWGFADALKLDMITFMILFLFIFDHFSDLFIIFFKLEHLKHKKPKGKRDL